MKAEWEVEKVAQLLCTNNPAERPFAVAKAYMQMYGRLKLSTLAHFTVMDRMLWLDPKARDKKRKAES